MFLELRCKATLGDLFTYQKKKKKTLGDLFGRIGELSRCDS